MNVTMVIHGLGTREKKKKSAEEQEWNSNDSGSAPLGPRSRFGHNQLNFQVFCPQNGTAILKGSKDPRRP